MNAERLLAHYERIADAPDAIPLLRRFILDLAVRGKLVPQDLNDEPALELLKRIAAEKARMVEVGDIRKPKTIPAHAQPPFPVPPNWSWSQIAEIGVLNPRNEAPDTLEASFVPMPMIAAEYSVANQHEIRLWGEIKKGYTHFAEGDVGLAKITPCFENGKSAVFRNLTGGIGSGTTELHIVRPVLIDQDYVLLFLKSPHFIETGIPKMTGTAGQKRVPAEYFAHSPFPLPPVAEQHRIIAKVDELMALCDRLEATRAEREVTRDRLTAASLARLNAPDPDTFDDDARFALDALSVLTARGDQIKRLRETILSLAVVGKLTASTAFSTPATRELDAIKVKKAELNLRKSKTIAPISIDERWCELPKWWEWARWDQITDWITYGFTRPMPHTNDGVPIITGKNVNQGKIILETAHRTSMTAYQELNDKDRPKRGDILVTKDGSIGRTAIVQNEEPFCINQSVAVLWHTASSSGKDRGGCHQTHFHNRPRQNGLACTTAC
jgi:type I restriction enzyme, S subunit